MHVSQRLRGWLRAALFLDLVDSGPPTPPYEKKTFGPDRDLSDHSR
jgi:hypothetical protein